jgi:uncharacterized protein (TIGR00369 family)
MHSESVRKPGTSQQFQQLQQRLQRGELAAPPVAKLIGFAISEVDFARAVAEMDTDPERHANPMGTLHGGILCDLADLALGTAMVTTLEDDESFTTLDLTIKFCKPIWKARLRAEALVVKRTRTLGLLECAVEDDKGSLVAKVYSTCMVLRGEAARGRATS